MSGASERKHYPACAVEVDASGDVERFECDDAEVWIETGSILISYFDEDGIVVLEGWPDGEQGWTLAARSRPRRAFLKPMAEAPGTLEGEIDEQGRVTRWRLRLGLPEAP